MNDNPNAIERFIDVINVNKNNVDWSCKKTKLLMHQACHEYQHICDPDPDHTWLANFRHLKCRRNGHIAWAYLPLGDMSPQMAHVPQRKLIGGMRIEIYCGVLMDTRNWT